jgi:hypothetical protein
MNNLFIPSKIRVGFQTRGDTFTGKLAYIIYYDANGEIKQEKSWNNWRDKNLPFVEFDNKPRSGYIFNKGVQRNGHWGSGRSVIRVYDPRDFEFEIDIDNLIGLLMHSDVSKRDIVEECVFAWSGNHVVLLPVNSEDYQKGMEHTEKQGKNVTAEELVPGHSYSHKKDDSTYVYLGHYNYFETYYYSSNYPPIRKGKQHVFYDGKNFVMLNVDKLSECISSEMNSEFSNLTEQFFKSDNGKDIGKITYGVPKSNQDHFYKSSSGYLYMIKFGIKDNMVQLNSIDYHFCKEDVRNKKIVIDNDSYGRHYLGRVIQNEKYEIINISEQKTANNKEIPIAQFVEILKSLKYNSAYYVDENKKKTEI